MGLSKNIRNKIIEYQLDFPVDRRTKEYKNYLRQTGLSAADYEFTVKEFVKIEDDKKKNKIKQIKKYDNKIKKQLRNLRTSGTNVKVDYNEFLKIRNLNNRDYKRGIVNILKIAKNNKPENANVIFKINNEDRIYTITDNFINSIGTSNISNFNAGSDQEVAVRAIYDLNSNPIRYINFESIEKTNIYNTAQGAYFPYYCPNYDLSRYQIFKDKSNYNLDDSCLVYALRLLGLEDKYLEIVKSCISNDYINKSKLKVICENIKIQINLYEDRKITENNNKKQRLTTYGKSDRKFNIALFENHYFIYEKYNKEHSSLSFIKYLTENKDKYLVPLDFTNVPINARSSLKPNFEGKLEYCSLAVTEKSYNEKKDEEDEVLIFADFETYTKKINDKLVHIPYLLSIRFDKDALTGQRAADVNLKHKDCATRAGGEACLTKDFIGEDCSTQFINYINKCRFEKVLLIFHNAKYDYNFLTSNIIITSEINSDGHFKALSGFTNKKVRINIKCSYNLFNIALKECPKAFNLQEKQKKEVIPYKLYNIDGNVSRRDIPLKEININHFNGKTKEEYKEFLANAKEWGCYDEIDKTVDIIEYSRIYCQMDVLILKNSYNKFKEWVKDGLDLNIDNYLTISSIADAYFSKSGCYEGVYQVGLNVTDFLMKSVYGGRVMTRRNEKIYQEVKINDFDAVSLYPSAMRRMSYPKGKPKVITNEKLNLEFLKTTDAYFVEIKITKVGIKRDFPILSSYDEGIRDYTNDMVGKNIIVNNITLEDLIKFHDIKFELLRGYYYDEGSNDKIQEVIQYLFNKRAELKKNKNSAEIIYKLLMNSAYGKTIQKPHLENYVFIYGEDKMKSYLSKNYNNIISVEKIPNSNGYKFNCSNSLFGFYNLAHIGSLILSMSKRIMNEVMCLAEDNGIDIYYQDTDSMHLKDDDIPKLERLFKETYNRDLIGKKLGQFHSDFSLNGVPDGVDVYSKKLIALGKKCYIDVLEAIDNKGKVYNGYHIRLKGVSGDSIKYEANRRGILELDLYELLYKGHEIEFDLTCGGDKTTCFRFEKDYTVTTQMDFKRKIKFC